MIRDRRRLCIPFLTGFFGVLLSGSVSQAATYLPLPDRELARRSPIIVRATVIDKEAAVETVGGNELVVTRTGFRVLEVLKGEMESDTFRVALPGGTVGAVSTWIPGTPSFGDDSEVLLFLSAPAASGQDYGLTEFGLSKFDILEDRQGRRFALRTVFAPIEDDYLSGRSAQIETGAAGPAPRFREADSFEAGLQSVGEGVSLPETVYGEPDGDLRRPGSQIRTQWVNIGGSEGGGANLFRWFWDTGLSPSGAISVVGTQTGLSDGSNGLSSVSNAVVQWSGVGGATVQYGQAGGSGNVVVNLDVDSASPYWTTPLACTSGGVIGLGGPGGAASAGSFKGDSGYYAVRSATVWMRKVTGGCYSAATFRTAVLHELGHTLGLGHSDQGSSLHSTTTSGDWASAVMVSSVPASRPSSPQNDDIQAILWYYGAGSAVVTPVAAFSFSPGQPVAGQAAQFNDLSTNSPTSWAWTFGDGSSSLLRSPSHAYAAAGAYTVSLTATNSAGSNTKTATITVAQAVTPPTSNFTFSPAAPSAGQSIQFSDTSSGSPTSWAWNFGDGTGSSLSSPVHSYVASGSYSVTLTVGNAGGSNSKSVTLPVTTPAPAANFSFSPGAPLAGQAVQFNDTSTGYPTSWIWNFGDGATSTLSNPSHTYSGANVYLVVLTAGNAGGSSTRSSYVNVVAPVAPPTADFFFSPAAPGVGQSVQFSDASAGGATSWSWNFGEPASGSGNVSSATNPAHAFAAPGTYTVTLTASNAGGARSTTRTVTVWGCAAGPTTLCVDNGRVRVEVQWRVPSQGMSGAGKAVTVSGDTGSFWFFTPNNIELIVKVVDGKAVNGYFWVFYGALSDVEYTITVTDTKTGGVKTYFNPQGKLSSVADAAALPSTNGLSDLHLASKMTAPDAGEPGPGPAGSGLVPILLPETQTPCSVEPGSLCVNNSRFRIRVAWRVPSQGTNGIGTAVSMTSDTGYFWFFSPGTPEIVIKVVDGTSVNGKFWLFSGALSDVEYTITVTDTSTGAVKTYQNTSGSLTSLADTSAF